MNISETQERIVKGPISRTYFGCHHLVNSVLTYKGVRVWNDIRQATIALLQYQDPLSL